MPMPKNFIINVCQVFFLYILCFLTFVFEFSFLFFACYCGANRISRGRGVRTRGGARTRGGGRTRAGAHPYAAAYAYVVVVLLEASGALLL